MANEGQRLASPRASFASRTFFATWDMSGRTASAVASRWLCVQHAVQCRPQRRYRATAAPRWLMTRADQRLQRSGAIMRALQRYSSGRASNNRNRVLRLAPRPARSTVPSTAPPPSYCRPTVPHDDFVSISAVPCAEYCLANGGALLLCHRWPRVHGAGRVSALDASLSKPTLSSRKA